MGAAASPVPWFWALPGVLLPIRRPLAWGAACLLPSLPTAELSWLKTEMAKNSPFPEPALQPQPVLACAGRLPADSAQTPQRGEASLLPWVCGGAGSSILREAGPPGTLQGVPAPRLAGAWDVPPPQHLTAPCSRSCPAARLADSGLHPPSQGHCLSVSPWGRPTDPLGAAVLQCGAAPQRSGEARPCHPLGAMLKGEKELQNPLKSFAERRASPVFSPCAGRDRTGSPLGTSLPPPSPG